MTPQLYPKILLPKENYHLFSGNTTSESLIRYFDKPLAGGILDSRGKVLQKFICDPAKGIQDLSTSILGNYKIVHTKISLTKTGKADFGPYCEPDFQASDPIEGEHFNIDENRAFWIAKIEDIEGVTTEIVLGKELVVKNAICYIQHTPTKGNFWHFSIRWNVDGVPISDLENPKEIEKLSQKIGATARALFTEIVEIIGSDRDDFPINFYSN